jgi:hypothetical protein
MGLNAVLPYMQGIVNDLPIPGGGQPLLAYITPPTQKALTNPVAYIIPGPSPGKRQSAPRGAGFMEIVWSIDHYIKYLTNPNATNLDQQFPLIVDAVLFAYWGTKMGTQITDAVTGRTTGIIAIGEEIEVIPEPVRTPASFRSLLFDALIRITVKEVIQA